MVVTVLTSLATKRRSMDVINTKMLSSLSGKLLPEADIDYRAEDMPEDSRLWIELLGMIRRSVEKKLEAIGWQPGDTLQNAETIKDLYFYGHLQFIRFSGTRLKPSEQWGFVLEPVIGEQEGEGGKDGCWESREQYERMKKILDPHRKELVQLLGRLKAVAD